jgi:uncharacterized protein (DUF1919 family)
MSAHAPPEADLANGHASGRTLRMLPARAYRRLRRWRGTTADRLIASLLRQRVRARDFCLVSNNCWGSALYPALGLEYRTPFVGLFLWPECYLRLLADFRRLLRYPLRFVPDSRHEELREARARQGLGYPIATLGGAVEIHFRHYADEQEAARKWARRLGRLSGDDGELFFKFCDHDRPTPAQLAAFDALSWAHKVCFVGAPGHGLGCGVWVRDAAGGHVPDGWRLFRVGMKYFDVARWLEGGRGRPSGALRLAALLGG